MFCNCPVRCKGGKYVSRATYYGHAQYRTPVFGETFRQYLDTGPGNSNGQDSSLGKRRRVTQEPENNSCGTQMRLEDSPPASPPPHGFPQQPMSPELGGLDPPSASSGDQPNRQGPQHRNEQDANDANLPNLPTTSPLPEINLSLDFIKRLKEATLDNSGLSADKIERLRNPARISEADFDANLRFSLGLFQSCINASEDTYTKTCAVVQDNVPGAELLTYDAIRTQLANLSGVYPIEHDMCFNSCIAFTGPFEELTNCPLCHEARKTLSGSPRKTFTTIPLGPQIQAQWSSASSAEDMRYRQRRTDAILREIENNGGKIPLYDDFICGSEYLAAVREGRIKGSDTVLLFSIDGAQLYKMKQSDCWIYIWVILNLSPDKRYKLRYVLPGGCIRGPNHPKNIDSFLFPGLYHLAAIQNDGGLAVWDHANEHLFRSQLHLAFVTADSIGMAQIANWVGHLGKYACRIFCGLSGRHKPGGPHYYLALLRPDQHNSHPDVDLAQMTSCSASRYLEGLVKVIQSPNPTQYASRRRDSGLCGPTIFLGLPLPFPVPFCFTGDTMHLLALNIPELLFDLWRADADLKCERTDSRVDWDWAVLQGNAWKIHGGIVAEATPFLPGCFERPPRNPQEKISSGYKASEFMIYVYGLCPALLHGLLPDVYWRSFCKLVRGVYLLSQHVISQKHIILAHSLLMEFCLEFELLYYQRRTDRLHFVRPCIHFLLHLATETVRVGPMALLAQWVMERTIGNLGAEIRQHKDPYANLSNRALLRARTNTMYMIAPTIFKVPSISSGLNLEIGDGYALLHKRDETFYILNEEQSTALHAYLSSFHMAELDARPLDYKVYRWARLRLPNGQISRSLWSERYMKKLPRRGRNVKLLLPEQAESDPKERVGEVKFYFTYTDGQTSFPLAMVSLYSVPNAELQASSSDTVVVCNFDDTDLVVVDAKMIQSVVGMIPFKWRPISDITQGEVTLHGQYFVVEKIGLSFATVEDDVGGAAT